MALVASCPQCNHELLVPSEADSESWAKCPECRAFFQVKQATSRELLAALLVDSHEQQTIDLDPKGFAPSSRNDGEIADSDQPPTGDEFTVTVDDIETEVAELPPIENKTAATQAEDLEFDDQPDEPTQADVDEVTAASPDDVETEVAEDQPVVDEIATTHDDDLELDAVMDEPKKGDDLEAAAQRIDEWFRSAKTVPDTSQLGEDAEPGSMEEIRNDLTSSGPLRTNATIDMDTDDMEGRIARADFDLGEPEDLAQTTAAWDDADQMDDLLADADERPADEFAADFGQDEQEMDVERPRSGEEQLSINLFADNDSPEVDSTKRHRPRRERSFVRSLILIVAAGLFGSTAGYYALLWLRGPSIDFLNVAQFLPNVILPASFEEQKQLVRNAPPANATDTTAEADSTTADGSTEPQELPPATEEAAEPMPDAMVETDAAPAGAADQSTEVQAGYSEVEPSSDALAPADAVGERYSTTASETEAGVPNDSTATGVTSEKPATADLSVDDLAPTESPPTDSTAETVGNEPAIFDAPSANPLSEIANTGDAAESVAVRIANAPSFTGDDLRTSMDAAAKAQPQLVDGNFADSKAVAQAKGRSYAMLADLAQKAMFADASQQSAQQLVQQADELFRKTLADAHTRGEVAQILPRWIQSPSRKHGGVFFGGKVVSHAPAGSVVECKVEIDGGQTLTVLAPANAADQLDTAKPTAIVGWIVDAPNSQVSGYTGGAKSPAIWTEKLIPLE